MTRQDTSKDNMARMSDLSSLWKPGAGDVLRGSREFIGDCRFERKGSIPYLGNKGDLVGSTQVIQHVGIKGD